VGEAIAQVIAVWPDLCFQPFRVYATPEVIVAESMIEAAQACRCHCAAPSLSPTARRWDRDNKMGHAWKPALSAFAITFGEGFPAAETY